MQRSDVAKSKTNLGPRLGALLLIIGLISLAKAAKVLPFGQAAYSDAAFAIALGGCVSLEAVSENRPYVRPIQWVLGVIAVTVVVVF